MTKFSRALSVNVNDKKERKGQFDYLSWSHAVEQTTLVYEDFTWKVDTNHVTGLPLFGNSEVGYMVHVIGTADGITKEQWHPVVDNRNKPIFNPNVFDVNTSIQRAIAKLCALFGVGLYIYAGEDLPSDSTENVSKPPKWTKSKTNTQLKEKAADLSQPKEPQPEKQKPDIDWDVIGAELTDALEAAQTIPEVTKANMAIQAKIGKEHKKEFAEIFGSVIRSRMAELQNKQ